MEQFSLNEYMRNPGRQVVTRDGRSVKIICTDRKFEFSNTQYPVVALIKSINNGNTEYAINFTSDGKANDHCNCNTDLFFAPEKKTGWINIYKINSMTSPGPLTYNTEEEAKSARVSRLNCISTIKIEWEE